MASFAIHLAIGQEYLKKHDEKNTQEFTEGNIAPDLAQNKVEAHYGKITAKPNLYEYIQQNEVESSFNRGYFLDLLTDYLFYNHLINIDTVVEKIGVDKWKELLYNDYNVINDIVLNVFHVEVPEKVKKYMRSSDGKLYLFTQESLTNFIKEISGIDLDEIISKVKSGKKIEQLLEDYNEKDER